MNSQPTLGPVPDPHDGTPLSAPPGHSESMAAPFHDADPKIGYHRVWFNLLRIQRSLNPKIEKALRQMGIADPIWYEILLEAECGGAAGVQMALLEERLFIAQYALSRHVTRIEAAGFLRRERAPGAGRGQILFLTEAGLGLHSRIWQVYMQVIQAEIGPRMTTDEAYALCRMLIRLYP